MSKQLLILGFILISIAIVACKKESKIETKQNNGIVLNNNNGPIIPVTVVKGIDTVSFTYNNGTSIIDSLTYKVIYNTDSTFDRFYLTYAGTTGLHDSIVFTYNSGKLTRRVHYLNGTVKEQNILVYSGTSLIRDEWYVVVSGIYKLKRRTNYTNNGTRTTKAAVFAFDTNTGTQLYNDSIVYTYDNQNLLTQNYYSHLGSNTLTQYSYGNALNSLKRFSKNDYALQYLGTANNTSPTFLVSTYLPTQITGTTITNTVDQNGNVIGLTDNLRHFNDTNYGIRIVYK